MVEVQEARAQQVQVSEDALIVELVDGRVITVPLTWYPRLWYSTPEERSEFEVIGDGAYIHRPALDEDLSVAGILTGRHSGENAPSLKRWPAERKGRG